MKVGTDGVLLGAWVDLPDKGRILDIGTGTGLIALMCAQRCEAFIDAIEIDKNATEQAIGNSKLSPWYNRISIVNISLQHFALENHNEYDLIISNPPFFKNSLKPPGIPRSIARHNETLSFESLLFYSSKILKPQGRLAIIVPFAEIQHFCEQAYLYGLFMMRQTMVKPNSRKNYSRCLAEFSTNRDIACNMNELVIKDTEGYTDEYRRITEAFYLKI
jgi:tRNA1Val (adenine37-N6)-methyltransferase